MTILVVAISITAAKKTIKTTIVLVFLTTLFFILSIATIIEAITAIDNNTPVILVKAPVASKLVAFTTT